MANNINLGWLLAFSFLFALAMSVRIYAEVRRCREGLESDDNAKNESETKDTDDDIERGDKKERRGSSKRDLADSASEDDPPQEGPRPSRSKSPARSKSRRRSKSRSKSPAASSSKDGSNTKSSRSKSPGFRRNKQQQPQTKTKPRDEMSVTSFDVTGTVTNDNNGIDMLNNIITTPAIINDVIENDDGSVQSTSSQLPGDKWESFSPIRGDKQASELRKYHKAGDWEKIRDFFHRIRRRIIERQHYIMLLVKWINADWPHPVKKDTVYCDYLDAWTAAEPENLQCNIIRLETWIAWAWHGRTKAFAHEISPARVDLFYTRMDAAAAELARVLQATKKCDALVYAAAIQIATGRNDDQSVVQEYLQAVQSSNDPANYNFHVRALEFFCEKWHGSHTEMFDYARWITGQLPDGHPVWILIPMAHYEKAAMMESTAQRMAYWHAQHDEIVTAYEKALRGPWETTVNPDVSAACKKLDAVVRNWFVYALGKCRASELAQTQARVIGKRPLAELPWDENYTYKKHVKSLGFHVD